MLPQCLLRVRVRLCVSCVPRTYLLPGWCRTREYGSCLARSRAWPIVRMQFPKDWRSIRSEPTHFQGDYRLALKGKRSTLSRQTKHTHTHLKAAVGRLVPQWQSMLALPPARFPQFRSLLASEHIGNRSRAGWLKMSEVGSNLMPQFLVEMMFGGQGKFRHLPFLACSAQFPPFPGCPLRHSRTAGAGAAMPDATGRLAPCAVLRWCWTASGTAAM